MEFVRAMQDIVAGNFKGFALLRQLALSAPESQAGTTSSSPPKPMYIRVRLHNPASYRTAVPAVLGALETACCASKQS